MDSKDRPSKVFGKLFPPREIRILGAGRFGTLAARKALQKYPDAAVTVVDRDAGKVEPLAAELHIAGYVDDAVRFLSLHPPAEHVWIVPTVPVHVGFEWLFLELSKEKDGAVARIPVPEDALPQVPRPSRSPSGTTVYASFADFVCPDFCTEPGEVCTKSGKARIRNLFEVLEEITVPEFTPLVLRSWQLAGGVGGYPARTLHELLAAVLRSPGKYLIGTSCRCHGVLDALEWG